MQSFVFCETKNMFFLVFFCDWKLYGFEGSFRREIQQPGRATGRTKVFPENRQAAKEETKPKPKTNSCLNWED